jgi:hypothetical protein
LPRSQIALGSPRSAGRRTRQACADHAGHPPGAQPGCRGPYRRGSVSERWGWVQANGAARDAVCRGLMLALHRAGHITLPLVGCRSGRPTVSAAPTSRRAGRTDRRSLEQVWARGDRQVRRTPEEVAGPSCQALRSEAVSNPSAPFSAGVGTARVRDCLKTPAPGCPGLKPGAGKAETDPPSAGSEGPRTAGRCFDCPG